MLKNKELKFNFSAEVVLILVAYMFRILSYIASSNGLGDGLDVFRSFCGFSIYLLLFISFAFNFSQAKGGTLFSIAFFIDFAFSIESLIFNYIIYNNPINIFYLVIDVVYAVSRIIFILYGLNKIKNIKICYIFIGLLLLGQSVYYVESIMSVITATRYNDFTFYYCGWLLYNITDLLLHIAVLIYLLSSKKKKDIENRKAIEVALKTLKEEFEDKLITEDEYLSKKKEYINNL